MGTDPKEPPKAVASLPDQGEQPDHSHRVLGLTAGAFMHGGSREGRTAVLPMHGLQVTHIGISFVFTQIGISSPVPEDTDPKCSSKQIQRAPGSLLPAMGPAPLPPNTHAN